MAKVRVRELNRDRIVFEAMVKRVGGKAAKSAFARAINHEMAKANTAVKRELRTETGIKVGDIAKALKRTRASHNALTAQIIARGGAMPLKYFQARQQKYGVRAKPWNRTQRFKSAFIAPTLGGHVFHRTSKARLPIEMLWGPAIPKEMMREKVTTAFGRATDKIAERAAYHELPRIMGGSG